MTTLKEMVDLTSKSVFDYLDQTAEVPQIDGAAAQGDVLVLRVTAKPATTPMPACVIAVASEASSNTHTMHPNGPCFFDRRETPSPADLVLGVLTVPAGSTAFLSHQEHGGLEILPGTFEIRRQREFAGEWSFVAD